MIIKSLRTEIAVLALASILCIGALVLWFSVNAYESLYKKAASDDLDGLSENLSVDLISSVNEQDEFATDYTLLKLSQYDNVRIAIIYNTQGSVLHQYLGNALTRNKTPDQVRALLESIDFQQYLQHPIGMTQGNQTLVAKKRIGDRQSGLGFLIIENDLAGPLNASKQDLLSSILPWVLVTILINIILIFVFQNRALKPLVKLARFTRKIRETSNYTLVADVGGKKEIAIVTAGLNSMLQAINIELEKNKQKNQMLLAQQSQMEKLANFDALTGLPNRQSFMKDLKLSLNYAKQSESDLVLMFFDLEGFKTVNDSFGHEIGDRLLVEIAKKIAHIIGPQNKVARLGGDEFLVQLNGDYSEDAIKDTAKRFISGISEPIDIGHWNVQVGTSVGIAKAKDADFNHIDLLANADIAMYRAKDQGTNRYSLFSQEMIESSRRKLKVANAISAGLVNNEFTLHYQPKVDIYGKIIGYEALARWFNEELGHVSPFEFINIAERSGKISDISDWVIKQVCIDTPLILGVKSNLKIALNLSVHDLKNKHLLDYIKANMKQYAVNPTHLEFEITESAYLDNFDNANAFIEQVKQMGSSIALDDFGTGYSSLSYLTQININTLKIDKQFVDHIGISERSTLITNTIIQMAKQLNLTVCAEGVETKAQADLLAQSGCHILQGYYFGKPEPLDIILPKLANN